MTERHHYAKSYELRAFHALMMRDEPESLRWLELMEDEAAHGGYSEDDLEAYNKLYQISKNMSEVNMSLKTLTSESANVNLSTIYYRMYETLQRGLEKYL